MQAPSRRTSASSRSYSFGVSATGAPSRRTVREGVSTSISPNFSNGGDGAPPFLRGSATRRSSASMRASSSSTPNGFVTQSFAPRRENQPRHAVPVFAQRAQDAKSVHPRQHEIEHDQVGVRDAHPRQALG